MACKYLKQSPVAPYEEWCELHHSQYPPCKNCRRCEYDQEKRFNSTTGTWE